MKTIENDVYVAYQSNNSTYIAMDEYSISRITDGFIVESSNTIFGTNGFCQKAVLRTDYQWRMQELQVTVESLDIEMRASVKDGKIYMHQKQLEGDFEKIIDLHNDRYFFLYSGALIIPMIWLRGFDFINFEKITYQMLPMGYAEVKQLPDSVSYQEIRRFSMLMYMQNFSDIVKIQTDKAGKMLSFYSETNKLTIKIQP